MEFDLTLSKFLHPLSVADFIDQYWEKACYKFSRQNSGYYDELFDLASIDSVLSFCVRGDANAIDLVKAGHPRPAKESYYLNGRPNMYQVYNAYSSGYTLVINSMHLRSREVAELCSNLQVSLQHRVNANLYLTPPDSQGFGPHFDDTDVFVLQLCGKKRWHLYDERPLELPLRGSSKSRFREIKPTEPREVLDLECGDMLYIPRGHVHEACTSDSFSLHLSIGLDILRVIDVVIAMMHSAADDDVRFRRAVPPMWRENQNGVVCELQPLFAAMDVKTHLLNALGDIQQQVMSDLQPAPDSHFASLNHLKSINIGTVLTVRPSRVDIASSEDGAVLTFDGKKLPVPPALTGVFQFVASTRKFKIEELPDLMDDRSKIELARTLVREGLLRIVSS